MNDRPTRLIRARDVRPGTVIIYQCESSTNCHIPAARHVDQYHENVVAHELTVLDVEISPGGQMSAICMSESGEQCSTQQEAWQPVKVFAGSPPSPAERILELREQRDAGNDFGQAEEDELDALEAQFRREARDEA